MGRTKTKAVAYMRCSGLGQNKGDTWNRQSEAINSYAKGRSLDIVWEFRDVGVSGTKDLESRPGLAALLERVKSDEIQVVLVENATRLARDLMVSEIILQQLNKAGAKVIAAESGTDLSDNDDPTCVLIRQVLNAVAQFDKAVTVTKLKMARERVRLETGRCEGVKPYGTLPNEGAVVQRIKQLCRKPQGRERPSLSRIAEALNNENQPTRSGKPWSKMMVSRVIKRGFKTPLVNNYSGS